MSYTGGRSINAIPEIPGLYISEYGLPMSSAKTSIDYYSLTSARSEENLKAFGITHVLSIIDAGNAPVYGPELGIIHECVGIEDYDLVDLLEHIGGLCLYVEGVLGGNDVHSVNNHALHEVNKVEDLKIDPDKDVHQAPPYEPRLLVHCLQGVSRSGSVVIGLLMRRLDLSFDDAQSLGRKYRPIIGPNQGFVEQMRLWQKMKFDIYEDKRGEKVLKKQYTEWRDNRGVLTSREQDEGARLARKSVASLAARVGRLQTKEKEEQKLREQ